MAMVEEAEIEKLKGMKQKSDKIKAKSITQLRRKR